MTVKVGIGSRDVEGNMGNREEFEGKSEPKYSEEVKTHGKDGGREIHQKNKE